MTDEVKNEEVKEEEQEQETTEQAEETEEKAEDAPEEIDYKSKYYYQVAELDNAYKRFGRERENLVKYGCERILKDLISVLDTFDHSIAAMEKEEDELVKKYTEGIVMVKDQFLSALKKNGLEEIKAVGEKFDPNFHEALAQQPMEGKEDGDIAIEYQKGYTLNGRVLRATKVVVVKNN